MLFSSENNCNSSIETIIKDKITFIDNNNLINSNNNIINLNLNSNLNKLNNLNKPNSKLNNNYEKLNFCSIWPSPSPSRQDLDTVSPLLLSPLENENAKEIIQQKILDNVIITQKINEQNEKLTNYLANINEENNKHNVLLSPIDLISKNSNSLLENGINNVYVTPNLTLSNIASEQNNVNETSLFINPTVFSPESNSGEELNCITNNTNEVVNLENILNSSPEVLLAAATATPNGTFMSTPETTILSSPLSNTLLSSPELNNLSSPEIYDNLSIVGSPELNLSKNSSIINDVTIDHYMLNQELLKLQQDNLINNNNLLNTVENQIPVSSLFLNNELIMPTPETSPELSPELLNQSLDISDSLQQILENESKIVENKKESVEFNGNKEEIEEEEKEEKEKSNEIKCNKKESIINEGKPFIYVITESDNEEESGSEEDSDKKKKKYKKKYYVCSVCNHKSKRHYNVEVHLKTHEKNRPRPYVCDICKKCFCRAHDLERHKVIHKEKMFSCPLCTKKFGRLDSLKRHVGCKTCIKKQQILKNEK